MEKDEQDDPEEAPLNHLDEKTRHLDLLIERVSVLGTFLRDNMKTQTDEEINYSMEGPIKEYNQNLDTLAEYVLESKKTSKNKKELIRAAIDYSIDKYALRKRDRGELFFQHSLRVARKINKKGGDIETVIGGLLHDVIEENPKYRELKDRYKENEKELQSLTRKSAEPQKPDEETRREKTEIKKELENTLNEYQSFKEESLTSIKKWLKTTSKEIRINIDVESVTEIVNKLTKNIYDYYYDYLQQMFISERYSKKNIGREELLKAVRVFMAKGCDRKDNIETMERLEEDNKYSFTTQQRLYAVYKNITTINKMRNFLTDYDSQLEKHKLTKQREVAHALFYQLLNATLEQVKEDRQHLEEEHVEQRTKKEYSRTVEEWIPTTIKTKQSKKKGEKLSEFDLVIQKYDKWLHYSKEGLSKHKEDYKQQYIDSLAFEKILERFKKDQEYTLRGYKILKDIHENGNH